MTSRERFARWCPYKGNPDPWVVWQAADAARDAEIAALTADAERWRVTRDNWIAEAKRYAQNAEHWRNNADILREQVSDLTAERDRLRHALAELVALKDLNDAIPDAWQLTEIEAHPRFGPMYAKYKRRKPIAWEAARAALAQPAQETPR